MPPHERASAPPVITSAANPHVKMMRSLGRRKFRQSERAFLVEGRRLVDDAARSGASIRTLLVREDVPGAWIASLGVPETSVRRVAGTVFDAASDVEHAQGAAAICDLPDQTMALDDIDLSSGLVLIIDAMRDPGNMGTTLRSAAAAGVQVVLTTRGCVDPMSPKVVRAGMGAHFRLRIGHFTPELGGVIRSSGRDLVYADAAAALEYDAYAWSNAAGLVIGGETEPLSPELAPLVTKAVAIPMQAGVESLNAGVAASVLLFEAQRQGRLAARPPAHVDKRA